MDNKQANYNATITGDVDYHSGPYTITFPVNWTQFLLNVTTVNDSTLENNETFTLTINSSSLPINVKPGRFMQATVTIEDDDGNHIILC